MMAQTGSRHCSQRNTSSPQFKKTEGAIQTTSYREIGMLPRLLVRFGVIAVIVALGALVMAMQQKAPTPTPSNEYNHAEKVRTDARPARRAAVDAAFEVLDKYPHDAAAFTQGFTVVSRDNNKKVFIESTGLYGSSSLRHVDIESGKVLRQYNLPKELFGEGVTLGLKNELVMLTWKNKIGLVFDLEKSMNTDTIDGFTLKREFNFDTVTGEGWGATYDGENLVVSDGSSTIIFWNPSTMKEVRRVDVTIYDGKQKASHINELEFAKGFIYANVWYQPYILKIDPKTGVVVTVYDLSQIVADVGADVRSGAVLNGIAYDDADDVFYITGKLWNSVYKVRLVNSAQ